jgi:hypothetical protein
MTEYSEDSGYDEDDGVWLGFWIPKKEFGYYSDTITKDTDAFLLLAYLEMHAHCCPFTVANELATSFNWSRKRLAAARKRLLDRNYIEQVQSPKRCQPALYRWIQ